MSANVFRLLSSARLPRRVALTLLLAATVTSSFLAGVSVGPEGLPKAAESFLAGLVAGSFAVAWLAVGARVAAEALRAAEAGARVRLRRLARLGLLLPLALAWPAVSVARVLNLGLLRLGLAWLRAHEDDHDASVRLTTPAPSAGAEGDELLEAVVERCHRLAEDQGLELRLRDSGRGSWAVEACRAWGDWRPAGEADTKGVAWLHALERLHQPQSLFAPGEDLAPRFSPDDGDREFSEHERQLDLAERELEEELRSELDLAEDAWRRDRYARLETAAEARRVAAGRGMYLYGYETEYTFEVRAAGGGPSDGETVLAASPSEDAAWAMALGVLLAPEPVSGK